MSEAFPFTSISSTNPTAPLPMFREYAWDSEKDCFKLDSGGNVILLEGNEALKVWIMHVMRVERWVYLAYSGSYGVEIHSLIGKVLTTGERKSELRRTIKEALMVNPYIISLDKIEFAEDAHGRIIAINVTLSTRYGKIEV